jgi:hypothetical protein
MKDIQCVFPVCLRITRIFISWKAIAVE